VAKYTYDGLNRRTVVQRTSGGTTTYQHLYYNASWQVLETRSTATAGAEPETLQPEYQYVWSLRYVDSPVLRDKNTDANDLCDDERLYFTTDANHNVTALVDTSGAAVERYVYDPYGNVTTYNGTWSAEVAWDDSKKNEVRFAGYRFDPVTGLYDVRNRVYHPYLGWLQRDPLGYVDGMSLYQYCGSSPAARLDAMGLCGEQQDDEEAEEDTDAGDGSENLPWKKPGAKDPAEPNKKAWNPGVQPGQGPGAGGDDGRGGAKWYNKGWQSVSDIISGYAQDAKAIIGGIARDAVEAGQNFAIGANEIANPAMWFRDDTPAPATSLGAFSRNAGRATAAAWGVVESLVGPEIAEAGGVTMVAGGVVEVGSAGGGTPIVIPAEAAGAGMIAVGVGATAHGIISDAVFLKKGFVSSSGGSSGSGSGGAGNLKPVDLKDLKRAGVDVHEVKRGYVGDSNVSKYNLQVESGTGRVVLVPVRKGSGPPVRTDMTVQDVKDIYGH
jgi:RHS repeat-associated protein